MRPRGDVLLLLVEAVFDDDGDDEAEVESVVVPLRFD
jgi:hypothetical protein